VKLSSKSIFGMAKRTGRVVCGGALVLALSACTSLLDVDNPNNVSSDALDVPVAASAIVNGAENLTGNALSSMLNFYVPATDEAYWVGSRDDYRLLDSGEFGINTNEYVQSAYLKVAAARWMADQAVQKVEKFNADGVLQDKQLLVRAYLIAATNYINIADKYDDIAFSDRIAAGANYGEANMSALYDSATKWLEAAEPLATGDNKAYVLGLRARAKQSKAIWQKLNPAGTVPASGLVADVGSMVADAQAALAAKSGAWSFDIVTNDLNQGDGSGGGFGFEMNSRVEYTPNADLVNIGSNSKPTKVIAVDPVSGGIDATATKLIGAVVFAPSATLNSPVLTQASAREMYLIIAEAALAAGNNAGFDAAINSLRAIDGKAAYTGAGPTRLQLLQWERRIQLIFQGRRLNDMYRFGVKDPRWVSASLAFNKPGCLFPIPEIELKSNKLITGTPVCK
jgi:starch-binding outer membrane protein, SusD/RagB family